MKNNYMKYPSPFKKIKINNLDTKTNILSKLDKEQNYYNLLKKENGHGSFNNLDLNSKKNIDLANKNKVLGLKLVKNIKNLKLTNKNFENLFGVKDTNTKPVKINKKFLPSKFDNLSKYRKNTSMTKRANQFYKTFYSSYKKPEKYEPYRTKNFFFPSVEHMKLRKTNEKNVKKMFNKDMSKSYLSTDVSSMTKSVKTSKDMQNKSNNIEESLIKVNINNVDSRVSDGCSRVQPIINKYFGTKKPNKTKLILNKKKIKEIFDQFEEEYKNEVNAMPEDKVRKEETLNSSKISNAKELEKYNKQMRKIERQERKLTKNILFKNNKKHKENLEDYDPNAQLFDRTKYNNDIPQGEKHNRFIKALNKNDYPYNLVPNENTKKAIANETKELIRNTKIRFFKQNNNNKNKKIFITALERRGYPFNQLPMNIRRDIANNVRKDFVLRGGKDF